MAMSLDFYSDFFYAQEILNRLPEIVRQQCEGCQFESLSQTHHSCDSHSPQEQLNIYFEDILLEIDEMSILRKWKEAATQVSSPEFVAIYELKFSCLDWRQTMKTLDWKQRIIPLVLRLKAFGKYF